MPAILPDREENDICVREPHQKDFAYCDSGMIPWLLIAEFISTSGCSLGSLVADRSKHFPSSGEKNFRVSDPSLAIEKVFSAYCKKAHSIDYSDGVSMAFKKWRFNL